MVCNVEVPRCRRMNGQKLSRNDIAGQIKSAAGGARRESIACETCCCLIYKITGGEFTLELSRKVNNFLGSS